MSRRLRLHPFLAILAAALLTASLAFAQSIGGSISGRVVDSSGGVVAGATVRIVNAATGQGRVLGTDAEGKYEARELPPGQYRVTIEQSGFRPVSLRAVQLGVGQNARVQIATLEPVALDEKVEVRVEAAQVALVDPTTPTLSTSFGERQIRELPIINRDLNNLALLAPGVFSVRAFSFASTLVPFAANGSRGRDNNFIIDAVDNNEPLFGGAATQFTNSDLFAEYRILTNQYKAEYGRNSGSVVNIVTERGGNRWRGTAFWFGQHDNFNASNAVERAAALDSSTLFYENQIGGTLGGPIKSESSWVFMSYQWDRARQDLSPLYPLVSTLPTTNGLAELAANAPFATPTVNHLLSLPSVNTVSAMTAPCGGAGSGLPTTNPCTISQTFAPLTSPGVPVALPGPDGMIFTPDDTFVPVEFGTFLVPRAGLFDVRDHQGSVRWDQRLGNRDDIYVRYLFDDLATPVTGGSFPQEIAFQDLGLLPDYRTILLQRTQNLGLYWTRAWPRALHELRGSYSRISSTTGALDVERTQREDIPAVTVLDSFALTTAPGGTPQGTASLLAAFRAAGDTFTIGRDTRPRLVNSNIFQVQDNVSISRGKHGIKFGINFVRTQTNIRETPSDLGQVFYGTFEEYVYDLPRLAIQRFPNYLGTGGDTLPLREFAWFTFFQDDIQVSPNFVLSLGMRYENYGQVINSIGDKNPRFGTPMATDMNNWAPRLGFSWSPAANTVIRGGYGFFYNPTPFVIPLLVYQSGPISPLFTFFNSAVAGINPFPQEPWDSANLQLNFPGVDCAVGFSSVPSAIAYNPINCTGQDKVTPNLRQPYAQNYSLSLQRQMGRDWLVEFAYVGSKGTKLFQRLDRNPHRGWDILPGTTFSDGVGTVGCVGFIGFDPACKIPRRDAGRGAIAEVVNGANSVYHAGQISLTKRLSRPHGLALTTAYTWSHMIDNASEIFGPNVRFIDFRTAVLPQVTLVETITPFPQDPNNATSAERASSAFDRRHRLAASLLWSLPTPAGGGAARALFGDWQLNGFFTYQTGQPFSPINGTGRCTDVLGDGLPTNDRPDIGSASAPRGTVALLNNRLCLDPRDAAGDPNIAALINFSRINPAAGDYITPGGQPIAPTDARFVQVGLNRTGNAGRNVLIGPRLVNVDMAVFKNFPWGETKNLQFRLEAYNLLNHSNPGNPVGNVFTTNAQPVPAIAFQSGAPSPARVTGTIPENSIDAFDSVSTQSLFLSRQFMNTSARRLQFAVKYIF